MGCPGCRRTMRTAGWRRCGPEGRRRLWWRMCTYPGSGHLVVGGRVLAPERLHAELLAGRQWPPGMLLVIVGCRAAAGAAEPVAQVLPGLLAPGAVRLASPGGGGSAGVRGGFGGGRLARAGTGWGSRARARPV